MQQKEEAKAFCFAARIYCDTSLRLNDLQPWYAQSRNTLSRIEAESRQEVHLIMEAILSDGLSKIDSYHSGLSWMRTKIAWNYCCMKNWDMIEAMAESAWDAHCKEKNIDRSAADKALALPLCNALFSCSFTTTSTASERNDKAVKLLRYLEPTYMELLQTNHPYSLDMLLCMSLIGPCYSAVGGLGEGHKIMESRYQSVRRMVSLHVFNAISDIRV